MTKQGPMIKQGPMTKQGPMIKQGSMTKLGSLTKLGPVTKLGPMSKLKLNCRIAANVTKNFFNFLKNELSQKSPFFIKYCTNNIKSILDNCYI